MKTLAEICDEKALEFWNFFPIKNIDETEKRMLLAIYRNAFADGCLATFLVHEELARATREQTHH